MASDEELITRTVHDYFEGWYDADVARMDRALHADLVKRSPADDDMAILTKDVMLQDCAGSAGIRAADRWVTVDIPDICGDIAGAVVRSAPYREYVHLIRTSDGWQIADALWLPQ